MRAIEISKVDSIAMASSPRGRNGRADASRLVCLAKPTEVQVHGLHAVGSRYEHDVRTEEISSNVAVAARVPREGRAIVNIASLARAEPVKLHPQPAAGI